MSNHYLTPLRKSVKYKKDKENIVKWQLAVVGLQIVKN
jgi:hypothetical protein